MTKDQQKAYAKKLYLEIDGTGEQVETIRSIASKVNEKCDKKRDKKSKVATKESVHFSTIPRWAAKHEWDADLQDIKNEFYKRVEGEAAADREGILGRGATSMEISRRMNEVDYKMLREILHEKARFSMLWLRQDFSDYSAEEIKERKLSPWQEAIVFKQTSDVKLKHDEILAEASKYVDNILEVVYEVVEPPKVIAGD